MKRTFVLLLVLGSALLGIVEGARAVGNPTLYVTFSGTGSGTVYVNAGTNSFACSSPCSGMISLGKAIALTATPASGSTFAGWGGACSGTASCTLIMNSSHTVIASFQKVTTHTLSVGMGGDDAGTVTSSPAGISCPGDCAEAYIAGTSVVLTATPAPGSTFIGWSGACTGTGTCTLTMSQDRSVTATFTKPQPPPPPSPPSPAPAPPAPAPAPEPQPEPGPQPAPPAQSDPTGCTITGTPGDDVLRGTPGRDVVCGLAGNDVLLGSGGDDVLLGGPGNDRLEGGAGRDGLRGGPGADRMVGGVGADRLRGDAGNDVLVARDRFHDRLDGGTGRDRATIDRSLDHSIRIEILR